MKRGMYSVSVYPLKGVDISPVVHGAWASKKVGTKGMG